MELHFLRPFWFIAIIPAFFLCWQLAKINLSDNWRSVCDEHLLSHLLISPKHHFKLPFLLLALGSLIAIFALAGPSFEKVSEPIYRTMVGRVIALNLSPSMSDSVGSTKKIDRARFKLLDYLNHQKEGQTGLVVYTDEAHTISPMTEDNHTIANFVPALDPTIMPTFNDDTEIGLKEAGKLLKQAGLHNGNIVLVTDKITNFNAAKKLASSFFAEGYRLYVFDISSQQDNSEMQKLAEAGGGEVITLQPNNNDIEELIKKTKSSSFVPPAKKVDEKGYFWQDNGRIVVFFLIPLALLAFRRGYL